jgi:hypothetical protein
MDPNLHLAIVRLRAEAIDGRAERLGPLLADLRTGRSPRAEIPVTVRIATASDGPALVHVAELDGAGVPPAPLLVGERCRRVVAALSLRDGAVIADPFVPTADIVALLRLRARQLGSRERPSRRLLRSAMLARLRSAETS